MHSNILTNLIVVHVHAGRAEGDITLVLLDGRRLPSSERAEIREGWVVIVVGVPEGVLGELGGSTANGVPLRSGGVNTEADSELISLINHSLDEIHIVLGVATTCCSEQFRRC